MLILSLTLTLTSTWSWKELGLGHVREIGLTRDTIFDLYLDLEHDLDSNQGFYSNLDLILNLDLDLTYFDMTF